MNSPYKKVNKFKPKKNIQKIYTPPPPPPPTPPPPFDASNVDQLEKWLDWNNPILSQKFRIPELC